jgi:hypothetical protein
MEYVHLTVGGPEPPVPSASLCGSAKNVAAVVAGNLPG